MTRHPFLAWAIGAALLAAIATSWAQAPGHRMISPAHLKWADVPSLSPGAKFAVLEEPMS
jgi:hypothetical protein